MNRITASSTLEGATATNKWKTGYEYDAGGNITKLKRWDMDGNQFDAMEYNYENTASGYKTNTNKLRWVCKIYCPRIYNWDNPLEHFLEYGRCSC